jgi:DNA-binding NarL/FixJ family response regulator
MIRLLVIDDHPVALTGFRNMFRPVRDGIEIVRTEATAEAAIAGVPADSFDLIVLDLWLGKSDPILNITGLRKHFPGKPVVIFTSEESAAWQRRMFEAGARAYILKSAPRKEIQSVITRVQRGAIVFSDFISQEDLKGITGDPRQLVSPITRNQRAILLDLAKGMNCPQVAAARKTSVSNIEKTLFNLRRKFGAGTTLELISLLRDRHIL